MKAVWKTCAGEQDFSLLCLQQPRNLATMQRRLLSSADNNFGVVLQQFSVDADCMAPVVVHLDPPAQQHELQEIKSQVFCHLCTLLHQCCPYKSECWSSTCHTLFCCSIGMQDVETQLLRAAAHPQISWAALSGKNRRLR